EFDIMFNEGISRAGSIIDIGVEYGLIEKKGTWFSYNGNRLGQGREAVREELKKNPKMIDELEKLILARSNEGTAPAFKRVEENAPEPVEV
ncbi:MAG TPA: DNA recombination/repair protein RecA, partial [Rhabdochlamydiaceae bacterium]